MPYGHPDFCRLIPCSCTVQAQHAKAASSRAGILDALHAELGKLRWCTFSSFNLERPLDPYAVDVDGERYDLAAQRESLLAAWAAAESFARNPIGWFYVWGPAGSGKSHLAASIANDVAGQGGNVAYVTAGGLMNFLKAGFVDNSGAARLSAVKQVELLIIDDLGTQLKANEGSWTFEQFYELLNQRYLHDRPTVLTSNYPYSRLDFRLADRIEGIATAVHLVASSHRRLDAERARSRIHRA